MIVTISEFAKKHPGRFANWLELNRLDDNGEYIYDRDTGVRKSDGVQVFEVNAEPVKEKSPEETQSEAWAVLAELAKK